MNRERESKQKYLNWLLNQEVDRRKTTIEILSDRMTHKEISHFLSKIAKVYLIDRSSVTRILNKQPRCPKCGEPVLMDDGEDGLCERCV